MIKKKNPGDEPGFFFFKLFPSQWLGLDNFSIS